MRKSNALLFLSILFFSAPAFAQNGAQFSNAYLMKLCERNAQGGEVVAGGHTACQAYIAGMLDYNGSLKALGTAPSLSICFPKGTTIGQMQDVVYRFLKNNPSHDAFIAAPSILLALASAYPCRKSR